MPDSPSSPSPLLYMEDLYVGMRFSSDTHLLDEAQIISFAEQFDPQPFHLDSERAKDTFFGELIASGWHTAAITMKLLVTGNCKLAGGLIGMGGDAQWPAPARPGDILRVESEVMDLVTSRTRKGRGVMTIKSETLNQRDEVVQRLTAKLMIRGKES